MSTAPQEHDQDTPNTEVPDLIDTTGLVDSLTGFEEIAIARAFGGPMDSLPGSITMRALLFVVEKRAGLKDVDAYKRVMDSPVSAVTSRFNLASLEGAEVEEGKAGTPETAPGSKPSS